MKCIHLICRGGQTVRKVGDLWESGNWDISTRDAERLVGGRLFLHEAKPKRSYFGGEVVGYYRVEDAGVAHEDRVVFRLRSRLDCKEVKWKGADHAMAWTSGVVDCEG